MATIKVKKKMNLAELIKWVMENGRYGKTFTSDNYNCVHANNEGILDFVGAFYDDTFTVEDEEQIDEDTKLYLVERYISSYEDFKLKYKSHQNKSIKSILENNQPHLKTTHFYTEVNNELILIWKNGKLVE